MSVNTRALAHFFTLSGLSRKLEVKKYIQCHRLNVVDAAIAWITLIMPKTPRTKANENNNRTALSATDMEQNTGDAPVAEKDTKGFNSLVNIHVISYRKLKHDPDGVSVKAVLDGIVRAGILADDSTEQVKSITFESRKSKEEKTIIEISDEQDN